MVRWLHFCGASRAQAAASGEEPNEPAEAGHQIIGPPEGRFVAMHPETVGSQRRREVKLRSSDSGVMQCTSWVVVSRAFSRSLGERNRPFKSNAGVRCVKTHFSG